jgi:Protein of unknown function (DUF3047)
MGDVRIHRTSPMPHSALRLHRICRRLTVCATIAACVPSGAQAQTAVDLLQLTEHPTGAALPSGWQVRAVRGQQAPASAIVDSAGLRYLRITGTARAAWFVRELTMPLASAGRLSWSWRVPLAPAGASMDAAKSDDAALRVFVVFARRGVFETTPRALFYTLSNGAPPVLASGPRRRPLASIAVAEPDMTRNWQEVTADPIADYRRLWHADAPRIVAIGVMQDTDQTRSAAIGDLMTLKWSTPDVTSP